ITYISNDSKLSLGPLEARRNRRNWSSDQFFVFLRQLTANDDGPVTDRGGEVLQSAQDSVRCLIKNDDSADSSQSLEPQFSVLTPRRWETEECERIARQS